MEKNKAAGLKRLSFKGTTSMFVTSYSTKKRRKYGKARRMVAENEETKRISLPTMSRVFTFSKDSLFLFLELPISLCLQALIQAIFYNGE